MRNRGRCISVDNPVENQRTALADADRPTDPAVENKMLSGRK
jgi:hypothetical protein